MSKRLEMWKDFSAEVDDHVEYYTVPQYGDYPDDQLCDFTAHDIALNVRRYLNRVDSNARGPEESKRDCLKMAHYISELWRRLNREA